MRSRRTYLAVRAASVATVLAAASVEATLLVYEPFDYPPDEILTGKGGAQGTTGTWETHDTITGDGKTQDWFVHAEGTTSGVGLSGLNPSNEPLGMHRWDGTVDNLPTSGGFVGLWGADDWNDPDPNAGEPGRNLDASIGLDPGVTASFQPGTTTWFSYVAVRGWDRNEETPSLMICSDPSPNESRGASLTNSGSGFGTGGGPPRDNRPHIYPMFFEGGTVNNLHGVWNGTWNNPAFTVPADSRMDWQELDADGFFGAVNIVVGKIQWDADTGGEDIVSVARFLEEDTVSEAAFDALIAAQPNLSSANWDPANKPDLDQSEFDTLNIAGLKFFVDEIRIATTFEEAITGGVSPSVPLQLRITRSDSELTIRWESQDGMLYNLRSSTDLSSAEPRDWPVYDGKMELAGTPPENSLTIALPDDDSRFFVIEEFPPPPVVILADDFESGIGDWTTGSDGAEGTAWELGSPSNVGPGEANSPANCFGTNIVADYETGANVWLRSPAIDLTLAEAATLSYAQFRDIEEGFDLGTLAVIDAADGSQLAVIENEIDGVTAEWETVTHAIPVDGLGKIIKLEFRFESDDIGNFAGWYVDDVTITAPAP